MASLWRFTGREEFLMKQIWLTHEPDGRWLDADLLVRAVEEIMFYAMASEVSNQHADHCAKSNMSIIEMVGSEEQLGDVLNKISNEMFRGCFLGRHMREKTVMVMFDVLIHYRWDAKVALVIAAFALRYAEFWLIMKLSHCNPLAASIAVLKKLPNDLGMLKPRFQALSALVDAMVEVTKRIIEFEGLPLQHVSLDEEAIFSVTKALIHKAAYLVIKSALACFSQLIELTAANPEQAVKRESIAIWELFSVECKLSSICNNLMEHVHACHQLTEAKLYDKFLSLFKEPGADNQHVLSMLFALKDNFPLVNSSSSKLGVSELKNKVVACLVSKPELLPIEQLLLLVQKMHDDPRRMNLDGNFEIVWIPISSTDTWTRAEEDIFYFLSNSLPWLSVRQPWRLSPVVVRFIKAAWNFKGEPVMVVVDPGGVVTNLNGIDMMLIWGTRSYPFSTSRESALWEVENWNLQLLLDMIDPLVTKQIEEDKNICIYGSGNQDWISDFDSKMGNIIATGLELEMVYVGSRKNADEHLRGITTTLVKEKASSSFNQRRQQFFWLRLESMRRSRTRVGHKDRDNDQILKELSQLLEADENRQGWALFGRGKGSSTDIMMLKGKELRDCLDLFQTWVQNVAKLGLVGAIRNAFKPTEPMA